MSEPTLITKERALHETILKWIVGDEPRAWSEHAVACVYKYNRGSDYTLACAIGQYLPDDSYYPVTRIRSLFFVRPELKDLFEDPESVFWEDLQDLHDASHKNFQIAADIATRFGIPLDTDFFRTLAKGR